jgi:hypothetical protein
LSSFLCSVRRCIFSALIKFVSRHDYTLFAWYRIVFGGVVLATAWFGLVDRGVAHWPASPQSGGKKPAAMAAGRRGR